MQEPNSWILDMYPEIFVAYVYIYICIFVHMYIYTQMDPEHFSPGCLLFAMCTFFSGRWINLGMH